MKHLETHPTYQEGCLICKLSTVSISAVATPSSRGDTAASVAMEERWAKDIPAYRRLVKDGHRPKGVDGSAALEARANTTVELESGHTMPQKVAERIESTRREVADAR